MLLWSCNIFYLISLLNFIDETVITSYFSFYVYISVMLSMYCNPIKYVWLYFRITNVSLFFKFYFMTKIPNYYIHTIFITISQKLRYNISLLYFLHWKNFNNHRIAEIHYICHQPVFVIYTLWWLTFPQQKNRETNEMI